MPGVQSTFPVTQNKFYAPILGLLDDGKPHSLEELSEKLIDRLRLKPAELSIRIPSGDETVFVNRFRWARSDLRRYGYITSPTIDQLQITPLGLSLRKQKKRLTKNVVIKKSKQLDNTQSHQGQSQSNDSITNDQQASDEEVNEQIAVNNPELNSEISPDERMLAIIDQSKADLPKTLLELLRTNDPSFFEGVANQVVSRIFGGKKIINQGGSNDGGIDGIIVLDELGFDVVCVQAKRYDAGKIVTPNQIKHFAASVMAFGGTKGVLVTASSFYPDSIKEAAKYRDVKIKLIDGERLVQYMIEYEIGVKRKTYELFQLNELFFQNLFNSTEG